MNRTLPLQAARGGHWLLALLALCGAITGCAVNPVTGRNELNLVSEGWELQVGAENYAPARQSQGGDYVVDPEVQRYVAAVGARLAAVSDRRLPYEFTVLNDSVPNAWALPGGKIAINRGLLTELRSEAELAAVLGHEIVHAAARHGAQGAQRGMLLQGAVIGAAIASHDSRYANVAQLGAAIGAQLINQKYGRDAERESDYYGMEYMRRAGYDPAAAVALQETFVRLAEGRREDFLSGLFASHPPSQERVENNRRRAAELAATGELGEERYRQAMLRLTKTQPAYAAYDEAQRALAKGDRRTARTQIQRALELEPGEGHFHALLGDLEQAERNWQAARGHYDAAIARNDAFFYYYLQRGLVRERLRDYGAATQDLERSVSLLPTANALNALGNIARSARRFDEAKNYYARAAAQDSETGRAALGALLELDLPDNPGQYLKTRHQLDANGAVLVEVSNATPAAITGIRVACEYLDAERKVQRVTQNLSGTLAGGASVVVQLPIQINPQASNTVRTGVIAATLAK